MTDPRMEGMEDGEKADTMLQIQLMG